MSLFTSKHYDYLPQHNRITISFWELLNLTLPLVKYSNSCYIYAQWNIDLDRLFAAVLNKLKLIRLWILVQRLPARKTERHCLVMVHMPSPYGLSAYSKCV